MRTFRLPQVSIDRCREVKTGGLTLDWDTVLPASRDLSLLDVQNVRAGEKYLRFGQVVTMIGSSGRFGPYDPQAADGREILARGRVYVLDFTMLEEWLVSDHPAALEGGRLRKSRLLATYGAPSLESGPVFRSLEAALPRVLWE